jgi:hypothetical protein
MANDSSLLPSVAAAPGNAAQAVTANPYNYSVHLDRLVVALDQLSLSMAFVADKIDNISDKIDNISHKMGVLASAGTLSADSITTIATAATGTGLRMKGPQDWIGLISTYKLYVEDSCAIGLAALEAYKTKIDNLPKAF